jgi:succinate dehydrogenase / fumarate reductase flavoprotein subunit
MGGLWVDYNQMTNIPGLFAVGEVDYSIHGANRLGANSLLSCIYAGIVAGPAMASWASAHPIEDGEVDSQLSDQKQKIEKIKKMDGKENPFALAKELGDVMTKNVTVTRINKNLKETEEFLKQLQERWNQIGIQDQSEWANQSVHFTRQLYSMLHLASVIVSGALMRNESRGAHFKPEFKERNDEEFLKTTIGTFDSKNKTPKITYDPVDVSLIVPRKRNYQVEKQTKNA